MQLIVITSPERVEREHEICFRLFELGLQTLHLRKPEAGINELRNWLQQLPEQYHSRLMLHTHHALAQEFAVKGLHFREANRAAAATTAKLDLTFSTSFHTLEDIQKPRSYFDYAFLSPIFHSISKKDYPAAFTLDELEETLPKATLPIIALGGIKSDKLPQVQELGFAGAAVLGAIWDQPEPVEAFRNLLNAL
ncbi:thiamine phosphate synthase [Pontibacter diazotrophicus]|uniref:Thiamine phosphate synthase n=1 Tax=Pontibacter diazotrophicus TaxID=1400979 RepID=A0A3D8LJ35_9BACT|nr:thiamine phosphate synthase [Pontibacter diazotrophicus]RDV16982.1 thiamine phosphate synthase [Pontibacter diazotrophicus]